ncbi:MAG: TonB-dependent receptor [Opitutales bacterium]|nr:TonB-dependent receptor [Opitutales bacterium]
MNHMRQVRRKARAGLIIPFILSAAVTAVGQTAPGAEEEDVFELSPFEVRAGDTEGYFATHTLSGTRLRTELRDLGSAISVITAEFMEDTATTGNQDLLLYTLGTEVGGVSGNFTGAGNASQLNESFQNPSNTTRVRGLAAADNTRNFFLTDIPWDGYNVDRVDLQRGPNALLFGFGSPAGIINASLKRPAWESAYEISLRLDNEGSHRTIGDLNQVILENELAVRVIALNDETKFRQKPAFEHDKRVYAAGRYEPEFFRERGMPMVVNAHYEHGRISANRPRAITPQDRITAFFRPVRLEDGSFNPEGGLGGQLFHPVDVRDVNSQAPDTGQAERFFNDGSENPFYVPSLGNYGQSFGGPHAHFEWDEGQVLRAFQSENHNTNPRGIGPDGEIDGSIRGLPFQRMVGIDGFFGISRNLGLPGSELGQWNNIHLTDPSIFDFWNRSLDGTTKNEIQEWDNYSASVSQSFFDNAFGYELAYDRQEYYQESTQILTGFRQAIFIDVNSHLPDGSPNPNAGRPFLTDTGQFGNSSDDQVRDALRLTGFGEFDFRDHGEDSWWRRLLGRHVLTGLLSEETTTTRSTGWESFGMGDDYGEFMGETDPFANRRQLNPVIYLGPSLLDRESAEGANIPGLTARLDIPSTLTVRTWDSTWAGGDVDPSAPWTPPANVSVGDPVQADNPANYVGWVERDFDVLIAEEGHRDTLATFLDRSRSKVDSQMLVLQSYFWDGAVVGMYGWRRDKATAHLQRAARDPDTQRIRMDDDRFPDEPTAVVDEQSTSWSVAVHGTQLFDRAGRLPVDVSFYYNTSENFQPLAGRVDLFGQSLAPPSGRTIDRSVLIATKDNRYALRVTRFHSSVSDATGTRAQNDWYLGQIQNRGITAANRFEFNVVGGQPGGDNNFQNTYQPRPGQSREEADAEEAAAIAGWRAHVDNVRALSQELTGDPDAFYDAWGVDWDRDPGPPLPAAQAPGGYASTEDFTSEGWEFEFTAQPTRNWRISANLARVVSVRSNIGDNALNRYVDLLVDDLNNTDAGNLRVNNGGANSETQLEQFNRVFLGNWELAKLTEGTAAPELRKWRFNLVTNYRFTDGALDGFNVGGAYRWQDDVIIGYPIVTNEETGLAGFDLDNPYRGPTQSNVDLWVGYERSLTRHIDWRIQLNVRNVFSSKKLIPINAQPDGSTAGVRLGPTTMWTLTNTFSF